MFRRLIVVNILLVAVIVLGVIRLQHDMQLFSAQHRIDQIQPESGKPLPKPASPAASPGKQEWADIAAHNPFSFDRNDVPIVVTQPAADKPRKPKPILFGTILLGKDVMAMLGPGDGTSRSSRPVHVGESFDGWTVVEIQEKTATVELDRVKETLIMNDPTVQALRTYEKTGGQAQAPPQPPVVPIAPQPQVANPPSAGTSTAKKQVIVHTPFGDKVMEEPQ